VQTTALTKEEAQVIEGEGLLGAIERFIGGFLTGVMEYGIGLATVRIQSRRRGKALAVTAVIHNTGSTSVTSVAVTFKVVTDKHEYLQTIALPTGR
jgi:hypothetical protein